MKPKDITPELWELVETGKIKKTSALYRWLNSDSGEVILDGKTYWIELHSYCAITDKARAELKSIMAKVFNAEYLYDKC